MIQIRTSKTASEMMKKWQRVGPGTFEEIHGRSNRRECRCLIGNLRNSLTVERCRDSLGKTAKT